jgi:lysophospholipase L1-like esterase
VALGDSVAAPPDSYVHALYDFLRTPGGGGLDALSNRAVGGEDSSTLRTGGQLASAIADIDATSDTKLVTIDIGGNDRYACGGMSPTWHLSSCAFGANFDATLEDLQEALAGDPGAEPLVAMAYYNPASGADSGSESVYDRGLLGTDLRLYCAPDGDPRLGLNDRIACISAARGALVADAYPAFKAGGQALMLDGLHPTACGHAVIATEFGKALGLPGPSAPATCPQGDLVAPVIDALALRPRRFVAARRGRSIAARPGARASFSLTEGAIVRFRVKRAARGRRVAGLCVAPTDRNRESRRCTRYVPMLGAFRYRGHPGLNAFRFTGRLAGRALRPRRYELVGRAVDLAGNVSLPAVTRFRIVRR